ncbi:MAG: RNA 2',3'-cyclic phosphodiesterase [Actinomycetota bacterium]|nr:RNA 2',3'-cyclic phosphodiesterase [Actinomycetota bacterium]
MTAHAFLAVDVTDDERHRLAAALTDASPGRPLPGRRHPPQNWHITLRFLGECSDGDGERIMHHLAATVDVAPARVWCDGLDAFPTPAKARVVYGSIDDPSGILTYLAALSDEAASDIGTPPEDRHYVPHLTLSRLRPAQDLRGLLAAFGEYRVPLDVTSITLFRTFSTRDGVRYGVVESIPLGR